jgi:hypothetical protein
VIRLSDATPAPPNCRSGSARIGAFDSSTRQVATWTAEEFRASDYLLDASSYHTYAADDCRAA